MWSTSTVWSACTSALLSAHLLLTLTLPRASAHEVNVWFTTQPPGDDVPTFWDDQFVTELDTAGPEFAQIPEEQSSSGLLFNVDATLSTLRLQVTQGPTTTDVATVERLYVYWEHPVVDAQLTSTPVEGISFRVLPLGDFITVRDRNFAGFSSLTPGLDEGALEVVFNFTEITGSLTGSLLEFDYALEIAPTSVPTQAPTAVPTSLMPTRAPQNMMTDPLDEEVTTNAPSTSAAATLTIHQGRAFRLLLLSLLASTSAALVWS
jgi:hypothetical protein